MAAILQNQQTEEDTCVIAADTLVAIDGEVLGKPADRRESYQMIERISRLRSRGFVIEMDDFGSGYSSLNMLSYMPIDVLKMDMQFVRNIVQSEKDFRLVQLVLDIAKYLKVPVVAEGVETGQQLDMLKGAGCDLVQGYYFSRPLPPEAFEELIEKEKKIERENET